MTCPNLCFFFFIVFRLVSFLSVIACIFLQFLLSVCIRFCKVGSIRNVHWTSVLYAFAESLLDLRRKYDEVAPGTVDRGAYFLEQSVVYDHFDASQRQCFRYEHCRFVRFFCSSGAGKLFGVISAAGFRWNTWRRGDQRAIQRAMLV